MVTRASVLWEAYQILSNIRLLLSMRARGHELSCFSPHLGTSHIQAVTPGCRGFGEGSPDVGQFQAQITLETV